jgi:ubiquinone/menaquinone biosynthesis C-methylase UbiE
LKEILPLVPGLIEQLKYGIDVLDVGCGHGHALNLVARAFPKSKFTGYDFVPESISRAEEKTNKLGNANVRFKVVDVAKMDEEQHYDLITAFDAIHDQAHPRKVLDNINRALRPKAIFLMADINASSQLEENLDHPLGPTFYTISFSHSMTVSLADGGEGLGTMWGRQKALELLKEAGFENTKIKELECDLFNCYYLSYK